MKSTGAFLRIVVFLLIVMIVGLGSFGAGVALERYVVSPTQSGDSDDRTVGSIDRDTEDAVEVDVELVEETLNLLESEYYYGNIDRQDRLYTAIEAMVDGLPDDYTTFLRPSETRMSEQVMSGEYEGIGVWVEYPDDVFTIVSPMRGSPAEEAGLQAGDVVLSVDGVPLEELSNEEAIRRVRGPEGTSVNLTIQREGQDDPINVTVERERIQVPAVMYEMLEDNTALLTVTIMGDKTTEELDAALQQALDAGAEGVILDLRNNGGGWVSAAQEMIGRFIPEREGPALYERMDPDAENLEAMPIIEGDVSAFDIPLVVLVNPGTASAAEIVAGALQDYERGTIIGTQTFGKGSIQRVHQFDDGSSIRITIAEWLTPEENVIQDNGIAPDITSEIPEELDEGDDPQLDRALEYLETGE